MLRSFKALEHTAVAASDGPIGHIADIFFDDRAWVVRFLVVDTGSWLASRKVLISPLSRARAEGPVGLMALALTRDQVRHSPDVDTRRPVSRQHEMQTLAHYGQAACWGGEGLWGAGPNPLALLPGYALEMEAGDAPTSAALKLDLGAGEVAAPQRAEDPHLRSGKAVLGYHIHASDGEIGHLEDLLLDEVSCAVRQLVVHTGSWGLGRRVLVAPRLATEVQWAAETVLVAITRQAVRESPAYDSVSAVNAR